ncbi:MAG: hypothetical protein Q8Q59_02845 [Luteolibacter sp.]|jgi:hypothetical protein|nr:hypothetical protein [Luteolibacter sp.]
MENIRVGRLKQPAAMLLLIAVDKRLTAFGAPSGACLHIDKSMRDHGLFQTWRVVLLADGSGDAAELCVVEAGATSGAVVD